MDERTQSETWANIPGWPGYQASTLGRIRSVDRLVRCASGQVRRYKGRVLKPARTTPDGRVHVAMCSGDSDAQVKRRVAVLVLETFVGPRPTSDAHACHNDGDPTNDVLSNLRWASASKNAEDRVAHGRDHHAVRARCPRQHPLEGANLVAGQLRNSGTRNCRACSQARATIRYEERCGRVAPDLQALSDKKYVAIMKSARAA